MIPGEAGDLDATLDGLLAPMSGVSLSTIREAGLLDRIDVKFVVPWGILSTLLAEIAPQYAALEIDGRRSGDYVTTYLDTPAWHCFRDHMAERPVRAKLRERYYGATGERWQELKLRRANGRTRKLRQRCAAVEGPWRHPDWPIPAGWHAEAPARLPLGELRPVLDVCYRRATLLWSTGGGEARERATIDRGLFWQTPQLLATAPDVAIVELKQTTRIDSPLRSALRDAGIAPRALSKYCLGVAALYPQRAPASLHAIRRRLGTVASSSDAMVHS